MPKKFIIIGTRKRDTEKDFKDVWDVFSEFYEDGDIIISGGCPKGGDRFAEIIARKVGATEENGRLIIHRPKKPAPGSPRWAYTKAYFERNTLVAKEAEEDTIVIACVVNPEDGTRKVLERKKGGTEDTLKKIENGAVICVV